MNTSCDICKGTGWLSRDLPISDPNFGKLVPCYCQTESIQETWLKNCGLSTSQLSSEIKQFKIIGEGTRNMMNAANIFLNSPVGILTIHGNNGVGKSTLAYIMTRKLIESGYQTVYTTGPEMFNWIRDGYNQTKPDETALRRMQTLEEIRILIIDELDKIRPTEWAQEMMGLFIDKRYRKKDHLGTVIICNDLNSLRSDVASRLMEGFVIRNNDPDHRRAG